MTFPDLEDGVLEGFRRTVGKSCPRGRQVFQCGAFDFGGLAVVLFRADKISVVGDRVVYEAVEQGLDSGLALGSKPKSMSGEPTFTTLARFSSMAKKTELPAWSPGDRHGYARLG